MVLSLGCGFPVVFQSIRTEPPSEGKSPGKCHVDVLELAPQTPFKVLGAGRALSGAYLDDDSELQLRGELIKRACDVGANSLVVKSRSWHPAMMEAVFILVQPDSPSPTSPVRP